MIHNVDWLNGLKVLDLSDNPAGKQGTAALAEFLQDAKVGNMNKTMNWMKQSVESDIFQ